jgi:hypothetical protein
VAGYESSFVNGSSASAAHGAVVSEVFAAPSISASGAQRSFVKSSAFLPCLEQGAATEAQTLFAPGSHQAVGTISAAAFDLTLPATTQAGITSQAFVLTIPILAGRGVSQTITDDAVELFDGPYEATLDVSWSSLAPLPQQIVQLQAASVAAHLVALTA